MLTPLVGGSRTVSVPVLARSLFARRWICLTRFWSRHSRPAGSLRTPVRRVKKARLPRREEVQALSPATIEVMRTSLSTRDATLLSVLAMPVFDRAKRSVCAGVTFGADHPDSALNLVWGGGRHENTPAPDRAAACAARRGSALLAHGRRSSGRQSTCLSQQGWIAMDPGGLPVVATPLIPSCDAGSRSRTCSAVRPAA